METGPLESIRVYEVDNTFELQVLFKEYRQALSFSRTASVAEVVTGLRRLADQIARGACK